MYASTFVPNIHDLTRIVSCSVTDRRRSIRGILTFLRLGYPRAPVQAVLV